ncbi:MAG TPA: NAD-dependent succinate-semialdehyde dehydrogenase [Bryobacteraceae bacterium]|nr:NAD-dependent succinate-semialdehyde dehydrogenase [Bryobacteraceae bacterium]
MPIRSVNPATGEVIAEFEPLDSAAIDSRLERAWAAYRAWRQVAIGDRASCLERAAAILEAEQDRLGRIMTLEMGKTLRAARAEAAKCASACRFYASQGPRFLADERVETDATDSFVRYQPIGPVLAVMPWNFPFWQVFRFAAPALMAGNAGLLKHASNVPQCALAIEDVLLRSGFPDGLFQTLLVGSDRVERILDDPRVAAATLTGSEPAGRDVACKAGRRIKKTVLELGGSDPFIVMPSADLDEAVATGVQARLINNGQSCIAAKRFIVAEPIADEFERRFVARMAAARVGDPMLDNTELGPLATPQISEGLEDQVRRSVGAGAKVLTGGSRIAGKGNYFQPTVLTGVRKGTAAYEEELFGPVAVLFRVRGADEAIELANDTGFGLGASVWTNDATERSRFVDGIDSGQVFVNAMVASDPRLPFGGVKRSGYGRELGVFGIREFVNIKTVYVKQAADGKRPESE